MSSRSILPPSSFRPSVTHQLPSWGCAVGIAASGASPSLAQPGQDAGTADPPTAVEVTVGATESEVALVPRGTPPCSGELVDTFHPLGKSLGSFLALGGRIRSQHLPTSKCPYCHLRGDVGPGWHLGCGAGGGLPDPRSAYSLPAWFTSPFGHLTPSGSCVGGKKGDRQTDGSCSDVKQRQGSESGACEHPGEQPSAGDRARSTFVSLLMEKLAGRRAERARSLLLKHC